MQLTLAIQSLGFKTAHLLKRSGSLGHIDRMILMLEQAFLGWTISYGISICLSKWAILLLYRRVFTNTNRWFSVSYYSMASLITITGIINTFIAIFECAPMNHIWNSNVSRGQCIDIVSFTRYIAIPNVISGVIMLFMPLPLVLKLNISQIQKIGLSATFLHGVMYAPSHRPFEEVLIDHSAAS